MKILPGLLKSVAKRRHLPGFWGDPKKMSISVGHVDSGFLLKIRTWGIRQMGLSVGALNVDQMANGIGFGFDETAVEIAFFEQRQKRSGATFDFLADVSAEVGIAKTEMAQKRPHLGDENTRQAIHGLPDSNLTVKAQLGKRQAFLHIADKIA